jgi:integrase
VNSTQAASGWATSRRWARLRPERRPAPSSPARFLEHGLNRRGDPVRPGTTRAYGYVLQTVAAELSAQPIAKIDRADIAALLHVAAAERGRAAASLARKALHRFFEWTEEAGARPEGSNPVRRAPRYGYATGSRVLTDQEIRAIWWSAEGPFRSILRLCLLLGLRRGEAGGLRWSEVGDDTLLIPAARRKAGGDLKLPLVPAVIAEINRQPKILGRDRIFGRDSDLGWTDWVGAKRRLDRELGLSEPWSPHDLRRTCRTRLHTLEVPREVVERILGHGVDKLSRAYDNSNYLPRMRAALEIYSTALDKIVAQPGAEVLEIGGRK